MAPDEREAELAQIWRDAREPAPQRRRARSRGPRFSGRGLLWVGGLIGVLLTVGILGLLATRVLSSVSTDDQGAAAEQILDSAGPAAAPAACEASRRTLETALSAYELQYGEPAADQQALVDAGLLTEPVDRFSYDPAAPQPVTGVGDCAG